jgi:hypothetical protein
MDALPFSFTLRRDGKGFHGSAAGASSDILATASQQPDALSDRQRLLKCGTRCSRHRPSNPPRMPGHGNPSIGVLQGHRLIPDPKWQVRHIDPALPLNVGGNLLLCGEIRRAGAGGSGPDVRSMSRQDITLRRSVCSASRGKTGYFSVV